jgi:hypothetical protein
MDKAQKPTDSENCIRLYGELLLDFFFPSFAVLLFQGARVWIRHPDKVWEGAEVVRDYERGTIKVKSEDGIVSSGRSRMKAWLNLDC